MSEVAVRYVGESDRYVIFPMIYRWCMENRIIAYHNPKEYIYENSLRGRYVTTYWEVPDEKDRTLFVLRWANDR